MTFKTRVRDESVEGPNPFRWEDRCSAEIFSNRRVVLFALPGAFTPTCSSAHLPGYEALHDRFTLPASQRAGQETLFGAGMRRRIGGEELGLIDLGVALRGREARVPEQLLDRAQVAAARE